MNKRIRFLILPLWLLFLIGSLHGLQQLRINDLVFSDAQRFAVDLVFTVMRDGGEAIAVYLIAVTVFSVIARSIGVASAIRVADRLTPLLLRKLVACSIPISLASGLVTTPAFAQSTNTGSADIVVMHHLATSETLPLPAVTSTTSTSVPSTTSTSMPPPPVPAADTNAGATGQTSTAPTQQLQTHTVLSGENFWTIAYSTLSNQLGRQPNNDELTKYWHQLVEQNRSNLKDPDNPDLLIPGELIIVSNDFYNH